MSTLHENLEKLHAYALTCRTAIYNEDAMTAIELAACTAKKVNEVIDLVNALTEVIMALPEVVALYDADKENLTITEGANNGQ